MEERQCPGSVAVNETGEHSNKQFIDVSVGCCCFCQIPQPLICTSMLTAVLCTVSSKSLYFMSALEGFLKNTMSKMLDISMWIALMIQKIRADNLIVLDCKN